MDTPIDRNENPTTVQKLLRAFMLFERAEWHQRSVDGYKPSEIKLMFCIRKNMRNEAHELKVSDISKMLHVTSPTVTQLLKGLETNGLIERNTDLADRRAVGISLTSKGELVTKKASEAFFASLSGLIEHLGEEKANQLAELLGEVFVYFTEKDGNSPQS
ncbi:MarR family winged helix-turn-helix transcriptional regulator [Tengunoibacter tsumagoiensis]|uniref:HTH marR-type domain-containing protein n=1 Tax=Tengunoibacter tsumagoiensis TaxID=2014871 RepID=A0A402AAD7_9CHLR|nr:MarR family transcriptional regulator [Tengunoibacter tsumagoiensis]GCE16100.1 hypothetical protein KTT_59590 [Tengunoibacter tsumagoiensis]